MREPPAQPAGIRQQLWRRPAIGAALAYIVGISLHTSTVHQPWLWISIASALLAGAIVLHRHTRSATILLIMTIVILGMLHAQLRDYAFDQDDIAQYTSPTPTLVNVEMRIDDPPRNLSGAFELFWPLPPRQVFRASVQRVELKTGWQATGGKIAVQITPPHPSLGAGQIVRATGMTQRPASAMNAGGFDWANYYRQQRILTTLQIRSPAGVTIVHEGSFSFLDYLRRRARNALALGFEQNHSLDHALLGALLLGDADPELRDVQEQFRRTGTSHHLAISGMHVAVLGGFILLLCRLLGLSPRIAALITGGFILLYGMVTLPSPPVVRAVLLCLSVGIGMAARRSIDMLQLLALSALIMLIYQPLDLFNAGFQLSFGTVLGLILLTGPVTDIFRHRDPLDVTIVPRTGSQMIRHAALNRIQLIFAGALTAWLVSLPMVSYHFDRLNPWAVIGSIALAPLVFLSLLGGLFKVILSLLLPSLAGVWADIATWPIALMRHTVDLLEKLPNSDLPLPAPSILFIIIYYLAMLLPLRVAPIRDRLPAWARLVPILICLILLCMPAFRR